MTYRIRLLARDVDESYTLKRWPDASDTATTLAELEVERQGLEEDPTAQRRLSEVRGINYERGGGRTVTIGDATIYVTISHD